MVHDRFSAAKSIGWRRRRERPLQRGAFPWVGARRLASKHTPEKVNKKEHLAGDCDDGCHSNKFLQWHHGRNILDTRKLRKSPWMPRSAQQVHRHENRISAQEGNPEMPDAEAVAHH